MNEKPIYSVVVPVFNSSNTLEELSLRVRAVFRETVGDPYELIFVDDGSANPRTWETLESLHGGDSNVKIIRLSRNFGQHAATLCGISEAGGEYIITMDDDLQHQPEDIPALIAGKQHDIVIGRFARKKHSLFKRLTSRIKAWFDYRLIGKPKTIQLTPFRLLRASVARGMLLIKTPYPFIPAMMFHISKDVVNVEASHGKRNEGKSGYSLLKLIRIFSNLMINNSSFLLRVVGFGGMGISFVSFCVGAYYVIRKLVFKIGTIGWTSTIAAILFMGGLILFTLGIIGEYLIRIVRTTEHKPTFFIKQKKF